VHVTPEEHSQKKVPTRPEDTAFLYYQFEPTELRGGGHVIEIAELMLLNNGQKVDMSGATASTPSSFVHWQGFPLSHLIDGNVNSVWVDDWLEPITVRLPQPTSADGFGFITGTVPERDPAKWKFRGSADGVRWTTLHSQADDLHQDAKRLEFHSFVFGETHPRTPTEGPTAPTSVPTEVAGAGATAAGATGAAGDGATAAASGAPASEQAVSASDSLLNSTWSPADDRVAAESAAASHQAVVESAQQTFEEAQGESQRKKEEEGSPEPALVASLSTIGVLLLLAAVAAVAYNVLSRPAVPPGKGDPLLSEGEEGSDRDAAPSGGPTGL
jgi:hypothetical protein